MSDKTFTDYLYDKLVKQIGEEGARQFIKDVIHHWGGERTFIAKRVTHLRVAKEKVLQQVGTKPDKQVAEENGISRRTLYRYIQKSETTKG